MAECCIAHGITWLLFIRTLYFYTEDLLFFIDYYLADNTKMSPKRSQKAPVWTCMDRIDDLIVCLICKEKLKYGGGTSNMIKHLRIKPPLKHAEMVEESSQERTEKMQRTSVPTPVQPTLLETINKAQAYKNDSTKKQELDQLVLRMVVKDLQPRSIVENDGFRKLVQGLNPRYQLPSRRVVARTLLPSLCECEVKKLNNDLGEAKYISLTTDIWTSWQTHGFITVSAHFISPEWELKSVVSETARMVNSYTAENIAEELTRVCNNWHILNKVCSVVTDNAANMSSAVTSHMKLRHLPYFWL